MKKGYNELPINNLEYAIIDFDNDIDRYQESFVKVLDICAKELVVICRTDRKTVAI